MPRVKVDNVEPDLVPTPVGVTPVTPSTVVEKKPIKLQAKVNQLFSRAKFKQSLTELTTDEDILKASKSSVFSAFCAFPKDAHFAGEQDDEEIILLMRAHIVTTVPWLLLVVILLAFPIALLPILSALGLLGSVGSGMVFSLLAFWYMGLFTYTFINFLYWYFNVYIVTNQRIVDVDWYSLVNREVNVSQIAKIQDITANQVGVLSGIFDYGHVFIQTAGTEPNFEYSNVPHPQLVARKLQELLEAATEGPPEP